MSQQAGWYDDPQDVSNLRYWDGVQWTHHTSPKQRPGTGAGSQGAQGGQGQQQWGAAPGDQGGASGYGQQARSGGQQSGYPHQQADPYARSSDNPYGQQANPYSGQQPSAGQWQQPMPGGYQRRDDPRAFTPDGQPLAGWWHRVGARLLDLIVLVPLALLVGSVVTPGLWEDMMQSAVQDPAAGFSADLLARQATWALATGLAGLAYEVIMTATVGGTVGKLFTGLRVRLREEPGTPGWGTASLRGLVYQGPGVLSGLVGTFAFLFSIFNLVNVLWPLWDGKRQAIHDKVAKTNVVRHRR
jgi:uncharacterized RDD family membrane protein YckC